VFLALFAVIASLVVIGETGHAATVTPHVYTSEGTGAERVCYPADSWGPAPDAQRPCYTVVRLFEDGSGYLLIGTAHHKIAGCNIPNAAEEQGDFTIDCYAIPQRGGVGTN
jgi:hypothetical protein